MGASGASLVVGGWVLANKGPVGRMASSESQSAARRCVGDVGNEIERADFAQLAQFVFAKFGDAIHQILDAGEGRLRARGEDGSGGLLAQSFDVIQAQANAPLSVFFVDGA